MIQGGGMPPEMKEKSNKAPIVNEASNGLKNLRGTLAMARTSEPDSATSQFFINHRDNDFLDYKGPQRDRIGYAVFGKVTEGLDVLDTIAAVKTKSVGYYDDVPVEPVEIVSINVV
jgi:cyclophilin family peptidyl-prolyl cis-trans isomerase